MSLSIKKKKCSSKPQGDSHFRTAVIKGQKMNASKDAEKGNVSHTVEGTRSKDWFMGNSTELSHCKKRTTI